VESSLVPVQASTCDECRCLAIMITSLYNLCVVDGIKITMIDSSLDKSHSDRSMYIYVLIVPSFLYIYIKYNGRRIKESIRSKERAGELSSHTSSKADK
jgi:hypothetical protein